MISAHEAQKLFLERNALKNQVAELQKWKDTVIDELICVWVYQKIHETDPKKAVSDLISWHIEVALDSAVSSDARKLIERGKTEMVDYDAFKIARKDLKHGAYYKGRCRNAEVARWDDTRGVFVHWRTKFGHRFLEDIHHPEDERRFDVFIVEEELKDFPLTDEDVVPIPFLNVTK